MIAIDDSPVEEQIAHVRAYGGFRCIAADCAWQFKDLLPGEGRGAQKHYDVMSVEKLCKLVLPPIADNAHLFFWRVSSMQREALDVIDAWGFTVKSELVWCKLTKKGKRHFGMGRHVRMEHEVCLIATRGRGAGVLNHSTRSTFDAPVGKHSEKPGKFFEIVEALVPGPRVELFARARRPGWVTLGNEVPVTPTQMVTEDPVSEEITTTA